MRGFFYRIIFFPSNAVLWIWDKLNDGIEVLLDHWFPDGD